MAWGRCISQDQLSDTGNLLRQGLPQMKRDNQRWEYMNNMIEANANIYIVRRATNEGFCSISRSLARPLRLQICTLYIARKRDLCHMYCS
jgi:hypothetical protein